MKMKSPLSPSDIEVLLHCHTTPARHPRFEAEAVQRAISMFVQAGMVVHNPQPGEYHVYTTTDKGDAFIEALLNTPEPVQSWTVPAKGE
jgi:hypothetical protein